MPPRPWRRRRSSAALGVDAITVTDGPKGSARMSALSLAILLQQARPRARAPVRLPRPVPDRHAVGPAGRARDWHPQPAAVHRRSAEERRLLRRDAGVRRGLDRPDQCGCATQSAAATSAASRSDGRRRFTSVWSANPTAPRIDDEVRRFAYKVEAGAEFAVTQPIYRHRRARPLPRADGTRSRAAHRGDSAVRQPPARRVPRQRGAERARARGPDRSDAPRRGAGRAPRTRASRSPRNWRRSTHAHAGRAARWRAVGSAGGAEQSRYARVNGSGGGGATSASS